MVPPRGDAEPCAALLAVVALAPLGLLAEEVEEAVQELLRGDLKRKKSNYVREIIVYIVAFILAWQLNMDTPSVLSVPSTAPAFTRLRQSPPLPLM